jgi:hypothetical protein
MRDICSAYVIREIIMVPVLKSVARKRQVGIVIDWELCSLWSVICKV